MKADSDNFNSNFILILIFGIILIAITAIGIIKYPIWSLQFQNWIRIVGAVGPPLVSLILAYLYVQLKNVSADQRDIEETQTTIQKQQKQILELNQLPQLIVDSWEVDEDRINFKISNVGDGTAYNLGYVIEFLPFAIDDPPIQTDTNPTFGFHRIIPFERGDSDVSQHKNILESGRTGSFTEVACLHLPDNEESYVPFSEANTEIEYPSDDCYVNIRLWLTYNDPINKEIQSQPVIDMILERKDVECKKFVESITAEPIGDTRYEDGERMILPENVSESRLKRYRRYGQMITQTT
jgi:hypothetical protein